VDLPEGATVTEVGEGATIGDGAVRLETMLDADVELFVRYALPSDPAR
jgi:hypothetical protein